MKKFLLTFLLLTLPAAAAPAKYAGGTIPSLSTHSKGDLDTTTSALTFEGTRKLEIAYASIDSWDTTQELRRHLGILPAIAVALLRARQHRHYLRITYHDPDNTSQVAIFEIPKQSPRVLEAVLQTRAQQAKRNFACGCGN